ncbi:MAG: enoyl-CoA hydratase [Candidatus Poseidoniales archaeon]|nr:MAG: enoyl-CoA hydratase [Candidatus Poseidoniales archaeon]
MMADAIPECSMCRLDIHGPTATITMDRVDAYNALNIQLISEIIELLEWTAQRSVGATGSLRDSSGAEHIRVLVLRSSGKHFCAGADINMMRDAGSKTPEENRTDSARLDRLFHTLWAHPCFTIGCVQGVALGGGAGLVSCLDHVIAEPNTRIALSEAKLGILPAVIGPYVYRKIGSAEFRRLSMLASRVGAEEALRIGLVNSIADSPENFDSVAGAVIDDLMSSGPMAVTEAKRLSEKLDTWTGSFEELRGWTLDKTSEMRGSREGQEGLSSFLERRPPDWASRDGEG